MNRLLGKRSLVRAGFVVFAVWYFIMRFALDRELHLSPAGHYADVLAALIAGALVGTAAFVLSVAVTLHLHDAAIRAGHSHRGAQVSLGRLPDDDGHED